MLALNDLSVLKKLFHYLLKFVDTLLDHGICSYSDDINNVFDEIVVITVQFLNIVLHRLELLSD